MGGHNGSLLFTIYNILHIIQINSCCKYIYKGNCAKEINKIIFQRFILLCCNRIMSLDVRVRLNSRYQIPDTRYKLFFSEK